MNWNWQWSYSCTAIRQTVLPFLSIWSRKYYSKVIKYRSSSSTYSTEVNYLPLLFERSFKMWILNFQILKHKSIHTRSRKISSENPMQPSNNKKDSWLMVWSQFCFMCLMCSKNLILKSLIESQTPLLDPHYRLKATVLSFSFVCRNTVIIKQPGGEKLLHLMQHFDFLGACFLYKFCVLDEATIGYFLLVVQGSVRTAQDTSPPCWTAVIALLVRPRRNASLCNHDNRELKEDVDVRVGVGAGELVQDLLSCHSICSKHSFLCFR